MCLVAMPLDDLCAQTVETAAVPAVAKAAIREQLAAVQKALIEQAKKAGAAAKVRTSPPVCRPSSCTRTVTRLLKCAEEHGWHECVQYVSSTSAAKAVRKTSHHTCSSSCCCVELARKQ